MRIKPGSAAVASLTRIYLDSRTTSFNTASGGTTPCKVEHGDGYRIYPPHSFAAIFVRRAGTYACTSGFVWMSVSTIHSP